jgi:uncharacterized membrane protein
MKRFMRPAILLILSLLLILFGVGFRRSISMQSVQPVNNFGAAVFFQTTATPQPEEDRSEIGSTDGITVLSFVIAAIIVIPILLQRKNWSQT